MSDDESLGALCRRRRLERGLTIRQLARLLKLQASSISRFERSERTLEPKALKAVLDYLKIELREMTTIRARGFEEERTTEQCPKCLHRYAKSRRVYL